jgi:hypothetical protein
MPKYSSPNCGHFRTNLCYLKWLSSPESNMVGGWEDVHTAQNSLLTAEGCREWVLSSCEDGTAHAFLSLCRGSAGNACRHGRYSYFLYISAGCKTSPHQWGEQKQGVSLLWQLVCLSQAFCSHLPGNCQGPELPENLCWRWQSLHQPEWLWIWAYTGLSLLKKSTSIVLSQSFQFTCYSSWFYLI